ncbi:MAG: DUF3842 family protein [Lentisphaeria bacterium]|nr:DUF3842 family protein [Lentisphaeria bacterium]
MNVLVIDGQGGGAGKLLVAKTKSLFPQLKVMAVGTNSVAASSMHKAGADHSATGENSVVVCCRKADVIIGPLGIVVADSLFGEITPKMALAVAQAKAVRILLPFNTCDNIVAGVTDYSIGKLVGMAMEELGKIVEKGS